MIDTIPFAIGFIIYTFMCVLTMDIYSKKEGMTSGFVLMFIYIYYSILAVYLISFVEGGEDPFVILVESLIYLIACGLYLFSHYRSVIKPQDMRMYGNRL